MSFWDSELGEVTGNQEDAFVKQYRRIPDNTLALAKIDKFIVSENNGSRFLSIDWQLIDGEFKGQKVTQKVHVFDLDSKKRHRALNMFKLLYQTFSLKPAHSGEPTDQDLLVFAGKIAGIRIKETEPNQEGKQYNWVSEVHKAAGFKCETGTPLVVNAKPDGFEPRDSAFDRQAGKKGDLLDELDIPF